MQEQKNVSKMGFIRGLDIFASADIGRIEILYTKNISERANELIL